MSKVYLNTEKMQCVGDDWLYNFVVSEEKIILRFFVPKEKFIQLFPEVSLDLSSDLGEKLYDTSSIFQDNKCNFSNDIVAVVSVEEEQYCLLYETSYTLQELKDEEIQRQGIICDAIVPIMSRLYRYVGAFNHMIFLNRFNSDFSKYNSITFDKIYRRLLVSERFISIAVNDEAGNFLTEPMLVRVPSNAKFITNINDFVDISGEGFDVENKAIEYQISSESEISENSSTEVQVKSVIDDHDVAINHDVEVCMLNGYSATSHLSIKNGVGNFNIMSLGLKAGDSVKFLLKDNGRTCAEHIISVV